MDKIDTIIKNILVHHSGTSRDTTTFESIKKYHLGLGWDDIGYHFVIEENGILFTGRDMSVVGAHCRSDRMNHKAIGICLTGDFTKEKPSIGQLNTLQGLLDELRKEYNLPRSSVLGHCEVKGAKTVCPGSLLSHIKAYRGGEDGTKPVDNSISADVESLAKDLSDLEVKRDNDYQEATDKIRAYKEDIKRILEKNGNFSRIIIL